MKNLVKSAFVAMTVCVFAIPASAENYVVTPRLTVIMRSRKYC